MIKQTLDLNLIPGRVLPRVNVSQYDKGTRTLEFTIYNGEILFNPTGYTAYIQGQKPDGHGFNYAATIENQKISVEVVEQMTAVAGSVACEIVIQDGTDQIGTGNFILQVEAAALPDDATMSESDYNIIQKAIEDAQAAAEEAESWSAHAPYIGANGNWYVYDAVQEQFVDTGVQAEGPQGGDGPQGPAGPTGNGIASITKTGTSGLVDTYTITYTNGNTTTFTVTNGKDGTGSGDMSKSVYDQNNNGIVDNSEKLEGHGASYFARNQSMTGASSGTAGETGLVPAPEAGKQGKYLRGDGTWQTPPNTTTGDGIKTKVAKTGTAQSAINPTLSAGTTLDNAIGTLLNNDATLNADIAYKKQKEVFIGNEITLSSTYQPLPFDNDGYLIAYSTNPDTTVIVSLSNSDNGIAITAKASGVLDWGFNALYVRKGQTVYARVSGGTNGVVKGVLFTGKGSPGWRSFF